MPKRKDCEKPEEPPKDYPEDPPKYENEGNSQPLFILGFIILIIILSSF